MHHGALTLPALALAVAAVLASATGAGAHSGGYLINETFQVETIGGSAVTAEQTMAFGVDGTVSGSAGCNTYGTGVRIDGHEIEIGKPRVTRRACPPPVMQDETRFLQALDAVRAYDVELDDNRLILFGEGGVAVMILTRVTD